MSRIFEALKKAGADADVPAFEPAPGREPVEATPAEHQWPPAPSRDRKGAEPNPITPQAPPPILGSQIRTLAVRVPAAAPILPFDGSHSRAAEQYRIVRTKIVQHPEQPRMLVVSSPAAGDGKTVSAVNIAGALALKSDANVLLLDGDFRRSSIAGLLGLPAEPGLSDVLAGARELGDAIVRAEQFPNLYVLPASKQNSNGAGWNPAELLDSPRWKSVSATLRKEFRFTIVDAPPIGAVADYDLIQAVCDGVILVVRPDHTSRTLCMHALESMPKAKLIGVLMNCTEEWFLRKTHGYYYYSSTEGQEQA